MDLIRGGEPTGADGGVLYSLVMGAVEGLTEFLPVSSTGHLIVTSAVFGRSDPAFEVAIQAGAITAILVLYWRDLWRALTRRIGSRRAGGEDGDADAGRTPAANLLWLLVVAAAPAAAVGLSVGDWIEAHLFDPVVVAGALLVGGVGLLVVEAWNERRQAAGVDTARPLAAMRTRDALLIGIWQILALIPGTSRSAATIVGGLACGFARHTAAEFSFLVGLPVLYGACLAKVATDLERFTGPMLPQLLLASGASFATALAVVGPFLRFLQRHTFRPFAHYRIAAGAALLILHGLGLL